jgi:hypothetical protein
VALRDILRRRVGGRLAEVQLRILSAELGGTAVALSAIDVIGRACRAYSSSVTAFGHFVNQLDAKAALRDRIAHEPSLRFDQFV